MANRLSSAFSRSAGGELVCVQLGPNDASLPQIKSNLRFFIAATIIFTCNEEKAKKTWFVISIELTTLPLLCLILATLSHYYPQT